MIDEDRRYYWRAPYGLTKEDAEIIRTRGIPTVDQERQIELERPDHPATLRTLAAKRDHWRRIRKLWNRLVPIGDN